MSNLKYWVWLSNLRGLGPQMKLTLLGNLLTPENIYYADEEELILAGADKRTVEALRDRSFDSAERILADCYRLGIRLLTIQDTEYPDRLRNIFDPPILLYLQGRMPLFDEEVAVAVVGSRRCTPYGVSSAETLSYAMAKQGALVLSGLARGIDTAALMGALRAGGPVAAVLGNGHDVIYPPENRGIYADVAAAGVLISEYPPGTAPEASHFPVRNRIMSGLSLAVLVVEAEERSGALITAHTALEQGRDVYAVPGPIDAPNSRGTNRLLRDGAGLVAEAGDLLRNYGEQYPHKLRLQAVAPIQPLGYAYRQVEKLSREVEKEERQEEKEALPVLRLSETDTITDDQLQILRALEEGTLHVDELIEKTQLPARRVLSALTMLELENYVQQGKAKYFTLAVTLA